MNLRRKKGLEIAKKGGIKEVEPGVFTVPSQTNKRTYTFKTTEKGPTCTCMYYELRRTLCKHIWAVDYYDYWKNIDEFKEFERSPPNISGGDEHGQKGNTRSTNSKNLSNKEKR